MLMYSDQILCPDHSHCQLASVVREPISRPSISPELAAVEIRYYNVLYADIFTLIPTLSTKISPELAAVEIRYYNVLYGGTWA